MTEDQLHIVKLTTVTLIHNDAIAVGDVSDHTVVHLFRGHITLEQALDELSAETLGGDNPFTPDDYAAFYTIIHFHHILL